MNKTLIAYTPKGNTPPYINVSLNEDETKVIVTVRSEGYDHGGWHYSGQSGMIELDRDLAIDLFVELEEKVRRD